MDTALDDMYRLEAGWTRDSAYAMVRIYLRFLDEHGAFLLVWAQAIFDDEELGRAGMNAPAHDRPPLRRVARTPRRKANRPAAGIPRVPGWR